MTESQKEPPSLVIELPRRKSLTSSVPAEAIVATFLVARAQFARSRLARIGAMTLAFFTLVAIFADVLAASLPVACKFHGAHYLFPNVTHPAALRAEDCESIARESAPGDWAVYPLVRFGPTQVPTHPEDEALKAPSRTHPFGTDASGRDLFARVTHGTRTSLAFGVLTALLFLTVGAALGALAGFFGGAFDALVSRLVEVLASVPTLLLVLAVQALVPYPSAFTMLLTIAATRWTEVARIVRAEVVLASSQDYVVAARALGASPLRILVRHVLPNVLVPALASAPFGVAAVMLVEASMSFLNVGATSSSPSWGEALGEARFRPDAWWLLAFPGIPLFLNVIALNLVGEALRDALDPRLRGSKDATAAEQFGA